MKTPQITTTVEKFVVWFQPIGKLGEAFSKLTYTWDSHEHPSKCGDEYQFSSKEEIDTIMHGLDIVDYTIVKV